MKRFRAELDVAAPIAIGWQVITDFKQYPEWNPLLRRVSGDHVEGAKLKLGIARELGSNTTVSLPARIRVSRPRLELAWGGGAGKLLDVHHYFRFEESAAGFRFIHGEDFSGMLLPVLWPLIGSRVSQTNYEALNQAFRSRCEQLANAAR